MRRLAGTVAVAALAALSVRAGFVRPETTRTYLHGPLSERMAVMWREGMITLGEVVHEDVWKDMPYAAQQAGGVRLLVGADDGLPDWESARWDWPDDATPADGLVFRRGPLEWRLEAAVPFGRRETVQARVTCVNCGTEPARTVFALAVRTGKEAEFVKGTPDIYCFYDPVRNRKSWDALAKTWVCCNGGLVRDGTRFVRFGGELEGAWDGANQCQRFAADLKPGEARAVTFAFGIGHAVQPDFAAARAKMRADWTRETKRAEGRSPLLKRLLVQILQCFAHATEGDCVLPRQGGQQRYVWPGETVLVTEALSKLGYGEYAKRACDFLLRFAKEDGSFGPFANNWASDTAYVLTTVARYCRMEKDAVCWRAHRAALAKAADWIESLRVKEGDAGDNIPGLFPPLKSTDSKKVFQSWAMTDIVNEVAFRETAAAAELFGDAELAAKCRARERDYRRTISSLMERWRRENAGKDTFRIPFAPDGRLEKELREAHFFFLHPGEFAAEGYVRADELERCRKWLLEEGQACEEGLYGRHVSPKPELGDHVWYTTWAEYRWFTAWTKAGRRDRAQETLDALLKYSVTAEGLVGERIHDENKWFWPWSPNASGAARIVLMMLAQEESGE